MARKKTAPELEAILERIPEDKKYIGRKLIDELVFQQRHDHISAAECKCAQIERGNKDLSQNRRFFQGISPFVQLPL